MALLQRGDFEILTGDGDSAGEWAIRPEEDPARGPTYTVSIFFINGTGTIKAQHANDGVNYIDVTDVTGKTADFSTNIVLCGGTLKFNAATTGGGPQIKVGIT